MYNVTNVALDTGWAEYSFTATASGPESLLEFAVNNYPQASLLDSISVTPEAGSSSTPEPGSLTLLAGAAMAGVRAFASRRKAKVQGIG